MGDCGSLWRVVRPGGAISAFSLSPTPSRWHLPGRSLYACLSGPPAFVTATQGMHPLIRRSWPVRLVFVGLTGLEQANSSAEEAGRNTSQASRERDLFVYFQSCCLRIQLPSSLHRGADRDPPPWGTAGPWRTLNCWERLRTKKVAWTTVEI